MLHLPDPSKFSSIRMSVSLVVRFIVAVRSPAKRNSVIRFQSVVCKAQYSVNSFSTNIFSSVLIKMALQPRFFANSTSVYLSPITYEPAKSYASVKNSVSIPVPGLRVGRLSSGKDLSINILSNVMSSLANVFRKLACTLSKFSCGYTSVPSPSWLVTNAHSKSSFCFIKCKLRNTAGRYSI